MSNNRDVYKSGYKRGVKAGPIESLLHGVGNTVTGNMFGSKTQKTYNKGFGNGEKDRRDSKKRW